MRSIFTILFVCCSFVAIAASPAGKCHFFGYNIMGCKPSQCSFEIRENNVIFGIKLKIWREDGKCKYQKSFKFPKQAAIKGVDVSCVLDKQGRHEAAKEIKQFIDGDKSVFMQTRSSDILNKMCTLGEFKY